MNSIDDLSALSGLTHLSRLTLSQNNITDIAPLVANEGLQAADRVDITDNPLNCNDPATLADLAALEARDVRVYNDCDPDDDD